MTSWVFLRLAVMRPVLLNIFSGLSAFLSKPGGRARSLFLNSSWLRSMAGGGASASSYMLSRGAASGGSPCSSPRRVLGSLLPLRDDSLRGLGRLPLAVGRSSPSCAWTIRQRSTANTVRLYVLVRVFPFLFWAGTFREGVGEASHASRAHPAEASRQPDGSLRAPRPLRSKQHREAARVGGHRTPLIPRYRPRVLRAVSAYIDRLS
jgi:hypothetical protein